MVKASKTHVLLLLINFVKKRSKEEIIVFFVFIHSNLNYLSSIANLAISIMYSGNRIAAKQTALDSFARVKRNGQF